MIYGVGVDSCDIRRIERLLNKFGARFTGRLLTPDEQQQRGAKPTQPAWLAKRFAAKEAVVKAMGTAFTDGLFLRDVRILKNAAGQPQVTLSARAQARLPAGANVHVSLSDEGPYAIAFAVVEVLQN